jgi:hypothetical protein
MDNVAEIDYKFEAFEDLGGSIRYWTLLYSKVLEVLNIEPLINCVFEPYIKIRFI